MRLPLLIFGSVLLAAPAIAYPNGAPWGSADPDSAQNCMSCHFDAEAVKDSSRIVVSGLGRKVEPGRVYELALSLENADAGSAGFLISASDGEFSAEQNDTIEARGSQARSISVQKLDGRASWGLQWKAPDELARDADLSFQIAVNAANDDGSPFGDVIHFKTIYSRAEK